MDISVIGAGGHSRSVIALLKNQSLPIDGVYDDSFEEGSNESIAGVCLKGKISSIKKESPIVLAIGNNTYRKELFNLYSKEIYILSIVHNKSFVDPTAKIGNSNLLFGNCFINAEVQIHENCIINTGAIIEHESIVGNHTHISVGAVLCGRVEIGDCVFIGANSVVKDKVKICDNVTIGAGSTVISDITLPGTYVGSPVRKIK